MGTTRPGDATGAHGSRTADPGVVANRPLLARAEEGVAPMLDRQGRRPSHRPGPRALPGGLEGGRDDRCGRRGHRWLLVTAFGRPGDRGVDLEAGTAGEIR